MSQLKVVQVPIKSIHPNAYNPNKQSPEQFHLLLESMRSDGFTQPIVVQEATKEIVDGYHRWTAAKELGYSMVPVVFVDMTMEQQMRATLTHNWARGNEDAALAAVVMRQLLDTMPASELAEQLQVSEKDIELEIKVHLPDVDIAELFPDLALGNGIPADVADLLRRKEAQVSKELAEQEQQKAITDDDIFFVSMTYTAEEGQTVKAALSKYSDTYPEGFLAICRLAIQNGW